MKNQGYNDPSFQIRQNNSIKQEENHLHQQSESGKMQLSSQFTTNKHQKINEQFKTNKNSQLSSESLKCIGKNKAFLFCQSEKCQSHSPFLCGQFQSCQCHSIHQECQTGTLKHIFKAINQKIIRSKEIQKINTIIQSTLDHAIDRISQLRQELLLQVNHKMKYITLNQQEKKFVELVNNYQNQQSKTQIELKFFYNLKMKLVNQKVNSKLQNQKVNYEMQNQKVNNELLNQNMNNKQQELINQNINNKRQELINQNMNNKRQELIKMVQLEMNRFSQYSEQNINTTQYKCFSIFPKLSTFFENSSIITTLQQKKNLLCFFGQKLESVDILYKASQHNFNLYLYYSLRGWQTNTMIICKTDKDKIIGGFTPLSFFNQSVYYMDESHVYDTSGKSFMFSLTQNQKFMLKQNRYALKIYEQKDTITFGNVELEIVDLSNVNKCCSYLRQKKSYNTYEQSALNYLKLNGNCDQQFTTKQWQVWKINFPLESRKRQVSLTQSHNARKIVKVDNEQYNSQS